MVCLAEMSVVARVKLEIYRLDGGHWKLPATHGGDAIVRAQPFEVIELDLIYLSLGRDPRIERNRRSSPSSWPC